MKIQGTIRKLKATNDHFNPLFYSFDLQISGRIDKRHLEKLIQEFRRLGMVEVTEWNELRTTIKFGGDE